MLLEVLATVVGKSMSVPVKEKYSCPWVVPVQMLYGLLKRCSIQSL